MIKLFIQILIITIFILSSAFAELPVPRWVSLKGDAHLRKGPTEDATIVYRYEFKGYPMEILRDIDGWRYVRDPLDGVEGWMAQQLFSGKRYAITTKSPFSYGYDSPRKDKILVKLSPKVHGKINECDSSWCELTVESDGSKITAWVQKSDLIGVYKHEIIN